MLVELVEQASGPAPSPALSLRRHRTGICTATDRPAEVVDGTMGRMDRREQQTELLPLLEGATTFDVVLRGYDRHQVHEHVERLEADLRIAVAERDTVAARLTELAGQLAAAHNEIDALHARLGQVTAAEPSLDDVSDRIRGMLSLAKEEAAEIRRKAEQDVGRAAAAVRGAQLRGAGQAQLGRPQHRGEARRGRAAGRVAARGRRAAGRPSWSATPRPGPRRCSRRPSPGRRS